MKRKKILLIVVIILLIIFIAIAGVIVMLLLNQKEPETEGVYVMDENNYTQILENTDERVNEGYFETYMNTNWTFENGTAETLDAILGNSPSNTKPIRCEVLLTDTGEKVFTTGIIPVGAQLPAFKLDVDLDAGEYAAVCMVYLLQETDEGTYVDYSSAGFDMVITVEN